MSVLRICIHCSFRCVAGWVPSVSHSCDPIAWARTKHDIRGAVLNVITLGFPHVRLCVQGEWLGRGVSRRHMCRELVFLVVTWLSRWIGSFCELVGSFECKVLVFDCALRSVFLRKNI